MSQLEMGYIYELEVVREADFGFFLAADEEDILLHRKEVDKPVQIGDMVEVFLYLDDRGRPTATTFLPKVTVDQFDWAKVVDVNDDLGLFIDIGISKDMLLAESDLPIMKSVWPQVGDVLYVRLKPDKRGKLYVKLASEDALSSLMIDASAKDLNKNVQGYIFRTAKVGSWMLTNEGFRAFIHESEREVEPRIGQKVEGRIIAVKEDGSVNVSLLPRKQEALMDDSEKIYEYLMSRNGAMPYSDRSMPEDIQDRFNMSKAAFKRGLGRLLKEGKIYQEEGWTYKKEQE